MGALQFVAEKSNKIVEPSEGFHKWKVICGITYHPLHPRERMGYIVIDPPLWKTYSIKV